jgi:hypothetical protein
MSTPISPTDLTLRPPRSPRVRLGGLAILARMLDKGRATIAKQNGEYHYNSSTDQHLVRYLGLILKPFWLNSRPGRATEKSWNGS